MNEQSTAGSGDGLTLEESHVPRARVRTRAAAPSFNESVARAFRGPSALYARYPGFITVGVLGFFAVLILADFGRPHGWYGGEALPQRALAEEVIKGDLPPGGPYAGLPTHLPPLLPTIIGVASRFTGLDPFRVLDLLSILAAIALPLIAYLTGKLLFHDWRPAAAGAAFVTFGAGLSDMHLGDASLFTSGHLFAPLTPLDVGLLLIPLAAGLFVRAAEDDTVRYATFIGLIGAVLAVTHLQSLVYLVAVLLSLGVAWLVMRPTEWRKVLALDLTVLIVGLTLSAWWWGPQVWVGAREGGILVKTVARVDAVDVGLAEWPAQFGFMLLLAIAGSVLAGMTAFKTKRLGPLIAVAWCFLPLFVGAFAGDRFPGELALRGDRLALLATFPMGLLAGLAVTEWRRWVPSAPGVYSVCLAMIALLLVALPTLGSQRDIANAQTEPVYAGQAWREEQELGFAEWFRDRENGTGTATIVAGDAEGAIAWYFAGMKLLSWSPPPFYSMAYNSGETTGLSETQRTRAQAEALSGTWEGMLRVTADVLEEAQIELRYVVLSQRDGRLAVSLATARQLAAASEQRGCEVQLIDGDDGLAYLEMTPDGEVTYNVDANEDKTVEFVLRVRANQPGKKLEISVGDTVSDIEIFEEETGQWIEVPVDLPLTEGQNAIRIAAVDDVELADVRGFTERLRDVPPGFFVRYEDDARVIIEIPRP